MAVAAEIAAKAGIWQRWSTYATTLHGNNVGLKELVEEKGGDYYRENMKFALLEFWSMRTDERPCAGARVVLEGSPPGAVARAQPELTGGIAGERTQRDS